MAGYVYYVSEDTELTSVANAIRQKTGVTSDLIFPHDFSDTIFDISLDCNATASDMLSGAKGMVNNTVITGNIPTVAGGTYNVSDDGDRTIAGDQCLTSNLLIRGITTSNISAENIKKGVVVKVGDTGSATRIKNVTGTMVPLYWGAPTYCPFMWANNSQASIPRYSSVTGSSSGTNAQKADGYYFYQYSTDLPSRNFRVPFKTKVTFYASSSSSSTTSITLNTGTTYTLGHSDIDNRDICNIKQSSTVLASSIYKITAIERVTT